jgi:hypothetical protein
MKRSDQSSKPIESQKPQQEASQKVDLKAWSEKLSQEVLYSLNSAPGPNEPTTSPSNTESQARKTERELFARMAKVKQYPISPDEPTLTPQKTPSARNK